MLKAGQNIIFKCYIKMRIGTAGLFIGNDFRITNKDGNRQASPADLRLSRQSARFDDLLRTTDKDALILPRTPVPADEPKTPVLLCSFGDSRMKLKGHGHIGSP